MRWIDYGGTQEPCPNGCGNFLKWTQFYDVRVSKTVRALKCPKKKCGPPHTIVGESKARGHVDMEKINGRIG